MRWRTLFVLPLALVAAAAVGCGPGLSKVEGTVTWNGSPVEGATVVFVPESGTGPQAEGITDSSGRFSLSTGNKPGAKAGTYAVTVQKTAAPKGANADIGKDPTKAFAEMNKGTKGTFTPKAPLTKHLLPEKYANKDKSGLKVTVPSSGSVELKLEGK